MESGMAGYYTEAGNFIPDAEMGLAPNYWEPDFGAMGFGGGDLQYPMEEFGILDTQVQVDLAPATAAQIAELQATLDQGLDKLTKAAGSGIKILAGAGVAIAVILAVGMILKD